MTFGKKLRFLRNERGVNQEAFGRHIGATKQAVSRYEREERVPKISVIKRFADALNVSVEWLVDNQLGISELNRVVPPETKRGDLDDIIDALVTMDKDTVKTVRAFVEFVSRR